MKLILCLSLGLLALPPVRGADQSCGNTQCTWDTVCSNSGTCTCDPSKGFVAGNTGDVGCSCPAKHHRRYSDGKCAKNVGQTCSDSKECGDHNVCDTTCKCDVSKNFYPGPAGATSCVCDLSKAWRLRNGYCQLKAGQPCNATSDCASTPGMLCVSGTCDCDTSKNFRAAHPGDLTCHCARNYGRKRDGTCGKLEGQACTADDTCVDRATCTSGTCTCGASSSPSVGGLCECAAATHHIRSDKTCGLIIGQTCSANSPCIDNAACVDGKCKCDATLNFDATTADGATSCGCDANSLEFHGFCYKRLGQTCNDVSECIRIPGIVCQDVSGIKKCTCNTANNYVADGDYTCGCTSNYTIQEDGICALKVGQACNANSAPCIYGAVCDDNTSTCLCDTASNYKAAAPGDSSCHCADNAVKTSIKGKAYCGNKVGGTCNASTNAVMCMTNPESMDPTAQNDKSSNTEAGLLVSLTVLVTGLVMTLILI